MTGQAHSAFRAGYSRWRRFAICILLLAIGALVLQVPVHAGPARHAIHQQQAAATASHCAEHHMPDGHGAGSSAGCVSDDIGFSLADWCPTCLTAAVLVAPPTVGPPVRGEVFTVVRPDPHGRSPEGILRPPRLIAA